MERPSGGRVIALLPPYGPKAAAMGTVGIIKLASGARLDVGPSRLAFLDAQRETLDVLDDAFALRPGASLGGPHYGAVAERRAHPPEATEMRWEVGGLTSAWVPVVDRRVDAGLPSLWCVPFQVPVASDRHLFVQKVNTGDHLIDLPSAVRSATLRVNDVAYPSRVGVHWDGPSSIPPGGFARRRFRWSDFGAPTTGHCAIALEIYGETTETLSVHLSGEPFDVQQGV